MTISVEHEEKVKEAIEKLKGEGYHVINLAGKSPDAIATKDGKLIAVEILPRIIKVSGRYTKNTKERVKWGIGGGLTFTGKEVVYSMFDEIIFFTYEKETKTSRELGKKRDPKLKRRK